MKRVLIIGLFIALLAPCASAATTIYMKQQFSSISGLTADYYASTTRSVLAFTTAVTNSTASGTNIPWTKTAGGAAVAFISPRVATAFTTSTSANAFTANSWAAESNAACNCTLRVTVVDNVTSCSIIDLAYTVELTTSIANVTKTGTQSACAVGINDRLLITWRITNVGTMGAGQTVTSDFAGKTASADGETFITMPDTISFQSEAEFIQAAGAFVNSSGTTVTITLPGTTVAGCMAFGVGYWAGTVETAAISDNNSGGAGTWVALQGPTTFNGVDREETYYAGNENAGGPVTYTLTKSASNTNGRAIAIGEWCGVAAAPLDTSAANAVGTGTTLTSNPLSTSYQNEILISNFDGTVGGETAGANYLIRLDTSNSPGFEERSVTTAGTYTGTMTTSSETWIMGNAGFKWGTSPLACAQHRTLLGAGQC